MWSWILLGAGCDVEDPADEGTRPAVTNVAAIASPDLDLRVGTQGEPCVADFDNDGDADLVVPAHNHVEWPVLRNEGDGTYSRWFTLPIADRHGCDAADVNGDGLLDFYAVIGARQGTSDVYGLDELWLQRPDGSGFDNAIVGSGAEDGAGRGREVMFLDSNGDALPDLFVGNEIGVDFPSPSRHYANIDGAFVEDTGSGLNAERGATCTSKGDVDRDGLEDLLLCGKERVYLYQQSPQGMYVDVAAERGLADVKLRDAELVDIDADGWLDVLGVDASEFTVRRSGEGNFPDVGYTHALAHGRDLAVGDIDADGDLDVYLVGGAISDVDQPDVLLFGDGTGTAFRRGLLPEDDNQGGGDTVTPLPDWRGTGADAFLVTNGKWPLEGWYRLYERREAP